MTPDQMIVLGTAFAAYLRIYEGCIAYQPTAEHLHSYCRGLLSDLKRKSVEPIANACGTAVRTLQEFLRDHVWDQFRMRDLLHQRLLGLPALNAAADLGTIGLIDETSVAKKGDKSPGVHRQYCGSRGKIENCIVTVHLGIVRGLFKTLIDAALFLPKVWSDDRERCREAKIPDDVVYRPKWRIALEQVTRAFANGLKFDWLTFDETQERLARQTSRQPGKIQLGLVSTELAECDVVAFDVGQTRMGSACRASVFAAAWRVDRPYLLVDRGPQPGDGRGEVLHLECAGRYAVGEIVACGVHALEC
jgi:hypothetical protein